MAIIAFISCVIFLCVWTREVLRRLPEDLRELRDPAEPFDSKAATVAVWLLTMLLLQPAIRGAFSLAAWFL